MGKRNRGSVNILYGAPLPTPKKPAPQQPAKGRTFTREEVRQLLSYLKYMDAKLLHATLSNADYGLAILDQIARGDKID